MPDNTDIEYWTECLTHDAKDMTELRTYLDAGRTLTTKEIDKLDVTLTLAMYHISRLNAEVQYQKTETGKRPKRFPRRK